MIRAAAPGKVVLWGEYAVLTGAPAMVMAVNRYARCTLAPGGESWRVSAPGFADGTAVLSREQLAGPPEPDPEASWRIVWHVLRCADGGPPLPDGATLCLDTLGFQQDARKLGIGSSAALCVAAYGAVARLLGIPARFLTALDIHHRFQGGSGSGIDVAASWHGGTLRFQRCDGTRQPVVHPWPLPDALQPQFVFAGESASTTRHVARFQHWRDGGGHDELDALSTASAALFEPGDPLNLLASYVEALDALDRAASLGIFSAAHRRLQNLALDAGVVYKPCGAGGGDVGAAFAPDRTAAARFARLAADNGFLPLALETAPHGIEVTG